MAEMILVDGTYYTAEDIAERKAAEKARAARVKAEGEALAKAAAEGGAAASEDVIRGIVLQIVEPLVQAVDAQGERIAELDAKVAKLTADGGAAAAPSGKSKAAK